MKRVLIIAYHFPPSSAAGTFRTLGYVRYLKDYGWEPVVVCPAAAPLEPVDRALLSKVPPDVRVFRTRRGFRLPKIQGASASTGEGAGMKPARASFAKRLGKALLHTPDAQMRWLPWALCAARKVTRRYRIDAIYTTSPQDSVHIAGLMLKTMTRLPWVVDFRDPWDLGDPSRDVVGISRAIGVFWRNAVLQHADAVISVTPTITESLAALYSGPRKPFVTIRNGYDPADFDTLTQAPSTPTGGRFVLSHIGELYADRNPIHLLSAIGNFVGTDSSRRDKFRLQFVGRWDDLGGVDLEQEVKKQGLSDVVIFKKQVPHAQIASILSQSTALVVLQGRSFRHTAPAKTYEYMAGGRPILALGPAESETARVLRSADARHILADMDDVDAIRRAITALYSEWASGAFREPRVSPGVRKFSRPALTGELVRVLDAVTRTHQPSEGCHLHEETRAHTLDCDETIGRRPYTQTPMRRP